MLHSSPRARPKKSMLRKVDGELGPDLAHCCTCTDSWTPRINAPATDRSQLKLPHAARNGEHKSDQIIDRTHLDRTSKPNRRELDGTRSYQADQRQCSRRNQVTRTVERCQAGSETAWGLKKLLGTGNVQQKGQRRW